MYKVRILVFFLFIILNTKVVVAQFPLFQDGDRVCFIGNSITMNGRFHNYIELYYATRFPDRKIEFYNCGISGDVASGMLRRMDSDILIHRPTWSVLMVGMNDVGRSQYSKERESEPGIKEKQQEALNRYFRNVDSIVRILMNAKCNIILQTPSIYDQTAKLQTAANVGVNDALGKCAEFLKTLSAKYKLPIVDYWAAMNKINAIVQKKDAANTIVGTDRVHPDVQGHFIMAAQFIKTQKAPGYVSIVNINAGKETIKSVEQCRISDIKYDNTILSFSSHETALPYPRLSNDFNPDSLISFTNGFNREILKISSLKKGSYELKIDNVVIGNYTASQLKRGINLATITTTPQYQQSEKVLAILNEYWGYVRKLRQIKYVEYQLMDEQMRRTQLTKENGKDLIEKRLEIFKNQPKDYIDFYQSNFNEYLVNKPMEKELLIKAEEAFTKIYQVNKPVSHKYKVVLIQ